MIEDKVVMNERDYEKLMKQWDRYIKKIKSLKERNEELIKQNIILTNLLDDAK
jgi:hypothetical protein